MKLSGAGEARPRVIRLLTRAEGGRPGASPVEARLSRGRASLVGVRAWEASVSPAPGFRETL